MPDTCEYFRSVVDRGQSASDTEKRALDEHLTTCNACSEYAASASATSELFRQARLSIPDDVIETAYRRLIDRSGQERRQTVIAIIAAVSSLLALIWFVAHERTVNGGSAILLMWFLGSAFYAWWTAKMSRRSLGYDRSPEFLAQWQKDVDRKFALTLVVTIVVGLEVAAGAMILLVSGPPAEGAPVLLALGLVLGSGVLYAIIVELPVLRMERSLISEQG